MKTLSIVIGASILLLLRTGLPAQRATNGGSEIEINYPGGKPPGLTPEVFAPGFITRQGSSVFNISFSPDGQMICFRRNTNGVMETLVAEFRDGRWKEPQTSPLFPEVPDFSAPDKAYYALRDNLFVMEKTASGWSEGRLLVEVKNSGPRPTVARNGNIYAPVFEASRGLDVFVLKWKDGAYQVPERLPDSVNSGQNEEHLYVAPDESYLLFDSERPDGLGKSDLYISLRNADGSWSQARNLGPPVNTPDYDFNVRVSPDGKYLFYCSGADGQLHWLNFQTLLWKLRDEAGAAPGGGIAFDYLGQVPPGDEPQVFAKGVVSVDGKNTHALQFSPDGKMLVFSRYPDGTSYRMVRSANGWSQPEETSFRGKEVSFDAVRKRLFYYDRDDLYFVRYGPDGFSEPTKLPASINTAGVTEYFPSVTAKGNLYFSRNGQWAEARIQVAKLEGEGFGAPRDVGAPVNTGGASHQFVAPDESYMLFNSPRTGSLTRNDVWVSFRRADGSWGRPLNLGERINRSASAVLCPTVSPDGKFLFFTRLQENGTGYVYWVSTKIVDGIGSGTASPAGPRNQ